MQPFRNERPDLLLPEHLQDQHDLCSVHPGSDHRQLLLAADLVEELACRHRWQHLIHGVQSSMQGVLQQPSDGCSLMCWPILVRLMLLPAVQTPSTGDATTLPESDHIMASPRHSGQCSDNPSYAHRAALQRAPMVGAQFKPQVQEDLILHDEKQVDRPSELGHTECSSPLCRVQVS